MHIKSAKWNNTKLYCYSDAECMNDDMGWEMLWELWGDMFNFLFYGVSGNVYD